MCSLTTYIWTISEEFKSYFFAKLFLYYKPAVKIVFERCFLM